MYKLDKTRLSGKQKTMLLWSKEKLIMKILNLQKEVIKANKK